MDCHYRNESSRTTAAAGWDAPGICVVSRYCSLPAIAPQAVLSLPRARLRLPCPIRPPAEACALSAHSLCAPPLRFERPAPPPRSPRNRPPPLLILRLRPLNPASPRPTPPPCSRRSPRCQRSFPPNFPATRHSLSRQALARAHPARRHASHHPSLLPDPRLCPRPRRRQPSRSRDESRRPPGLRSRLARRPHSQTPK